MNFSWPLTLADTITDIILLATTVVILLYTMYTKRLLGEARRQTELQIQPLVVFGVQDEQFYIKNLGNGIALDVTISDFKLVEEKIGEHKLVFDPVNIIEPKQTITLSYKNYLNDKESEYDGYPNLHPAYTKDKVIQLEISYRNLQKQKYSTTITTGKGGIKIKDIKRITA